MVFEMRHLLAALMLCVISAQVAAVSLFGGSETTAFWSASSAESMQSVDHSAWDNLLNRYIEDDDGLHRFAYVRVSEQDRRSLDGYLDALQQISVTELHSGEQFAYWVNLYNALTIDLILDHYPVESIREITEGLLSFGPWKMPLATVEGKELTLDQIEHEILRPIFRDPRIHYVVNCASVGCPNLQREALTRENTERLLEQAAKQYINHPRGVRFDGEALILSKIFQWYGDDFGSSDAEIIDHLIRYAEAPLARQLQSTSSIGDFDYDWSLNGSR